MGAGPLAFALTPASPAVRQVTVAMVQPGIINNPVQRVDASEQLTAELSRSGELGAVRPDLIVWGESSTALDLTLAKNRLQLQEMESLAKPKTVPTCWSTRTPRSRARARRRWVC